MRSFVKADQRRRQDRQLDQSALHVRAQWRIKEDLASGTIKVEFLGCADLLQHTSGEIPITPAFAPKSEGVAGVGGVAPKTNWLRAKSDKN